MKIATQPDRTPSSAAQLASPNSSIEVAYPLSPMTATRRRPHCEDLLPQ